MSAAPLAPALRQVLLAAAIASTLRALPAAANDRAEQAIVDAEDHRRAHDPALVEGSRNPAAKVRLLAARAIGRIGAAENVPLLTPLLDDHTGSVRREAGFALGLIGGDAAVAALTAHLSTEPTQRVRREIYQALGRAGTQAQVDLLSQGLALASANVRAGAADGLGLLLNKSDATLAVPPATVDRLIDLARGGQDDALTAAFALTRYKAPFNPPQQGQIVRAYKYGHHAEARALVARLLGKIKTPEAQKALLALLASADATRGQRVESLRALAAFPSTPLTLAALAAATRDRDGQIAVQALQGLAKLGADAAPLGGDLSALVTDAGASAWIRGEALNALAAVAPDTARPLAAHALGDAPLFGQALTALATLGGADALALVLPHLQDAALSDASLAAGAVSGFDDTLLTAPAKEALLAALPRQDSGITAAVAAVAGRNGWNEFAPPLAQAYRALTRPDDVEGKIAVLEALGQLGDNVVLPLLKQALTDDDRLVGLAAAAAYQKITGTNVTDQVPTQSNVRATTPPITALRAAAQARVELDTEKGRIVLQMLGVAPLTAANFVRLVASGFYDGLTYHRVVPNFVVQGGDPRGDGAGGPGYLIRDEASTLSHRRGRVGIATAGKDTGGSQFFIDHAPNLHLDGVYTVFAQVESGMDAADRLEQGDKILQARVLSP